MSWPTSSTGPRKADPYGHRGTDEVASRAPEHRSSYASESPGKPTNSRQPASGGTADEPRRDAHHSGLQISDVQVRLVDNDRLRAWATITFNDAFVVKGIRIIQGNSRIFVAMPSKQQKDGKYQDIAHPINPDFRAHVENCILEVYHRIEAASGSGPRSPADAEGF